MTLYQKVLAAITLVITLLLIGLIIWMIIIAKSFLEICVPLMFVGAFGYFIYTDVKKAFPSIPKD
jgi:hypothetical protein